MKLRPIRGHVFRMSDPEYGTLYCLPLSTPYAELRDSCLAVRVSVTHQRRDFPGWVRLGSGDPAFGYVVTQDIDGVDDDELKEDLGPLSAETMLNVERMVRRVLGL